MQTNSMQVIVLGTLTTRQLVDELERRGYTRCDEYGDNIDMTLAKYGFDPADAPFFRRDLEAARTELLAGRPQSALAIVERLLFPQHPGRAFEAYRAARDNRDPETGRPVNV